MRPKHGTIGRIYAAYAVKHGFVKVGFTTNPIERRISDLRTDYGTPFIPLAVSGPRTFREEFRLHRQLDAFRLQDGPYAYRNGELYAPTAGLFDALESLGGVRVSRELLDAERVGMVLRLVS